MTNNLKYFDELRQKICDIQEDTTLYIAQDTITHTYYIKGMSTTSGSHAITKNPLSNLSKYWVIEDKNLFYKTIYAKQETPLFFPNGTLTIQPLSAEELNLIDIDVNQISFKSFDKERSVQFVRDFQNHCTHELQNRRTCRLSFDNGYYDVCLYYFIIMSLFLIMMSIDRYLSAPLNIYNPMRYNAPITEDTISHSLRFYNATPVRGRPLLIGNNIPGSMGRPN